MEIEIGGPTPYENIRKNAYWTRVHLDTQMWPSDLGAEHYIAHLQDCIDNPTVGFLARKRYITQKPMNYPDYAWRNRIIMENDPQVKAKKNELETLLKENFKKTRALRRYIIENDRVDLDTIKPCKRYNLINKLGILLTRIF